MAITSFEDALATNIRALAALSAIIGTRISPHQRAPREALPCITFHRLEKTPDQLMSGASTTQMVNYRVDCWADTYEEANTLANAFLKPKPDGMNSVAAETMSNYWVQAVTVREAVDELEPPAHADNQGTPHVALEMNVCHERDPVY